MVEDVNETLDDALDSALEMTFPASDPIAVFLDDLATQDRVRTSGEREEPVAARRDAEDPTYLR